jgi:hypothetical protein
MLFIIESCHILLCFIMHHLLVYIMVYQTVIDKKNIPFMGVNVHAQ